MAKVTQNIISPIHVNEDGSTYISLDGKAFLVRENEITEAEITKAPNEFKNLVIALDKFKVTNEGVAWYHGISRFRFQKEDNKFFISNSEVLGESFKNHLLATGLVSYSLNPMIDLFENAAKNHDKFVSLEFATKISTGSIQCYVMEQNENFFVYKINQANKIYKFEKMTAGECFDYVKEQTGHQLVMASELLEGERAKAAETHKKVEILEQMIAFLKDQRGIIAEADKSIEEIKEADTLINSEIKRLEEEISKIKEGNEGEGNEPEELEDETKEVDSDEAREKESEEADKEVPEDEGEEGAKEVAEKEEVEEAEEEEVEEAEEEEVEEAAEKKTNEAELEEDHVDRTDGYVPGTLKYGTENHAEGTEIKVDAEGYTTSGQDESITVFIGDSPIKVTKREIALADTETI